MPSFLEKETMAVNGVEEASANHLLAPVAASTLVAQDLAIFPDRN